LIRLTPFLGAGILAAILGYRLANLIPIAGRIYLILVFLGLLFGMIILDTEPGWNVVLFLGFALAAGIVINWSGAEITRIKTWIVFSGLLIISLVGGWYLKSKFGRAASVLFPLTIIYMIGWMLFLFFELSPVLERFWILLGLMLFTLIATAVFVGGKTMNKQDSIMPLANELFVVLFNLCWLSGLV